MEAPVPAVVTVVVATVAMVAMMAMMTTVMMATAMPTAMSAAVPTRRRGTRGGEGESNGGDSGREDLAVHETFSWLIQGDHRPGVCPVSASNRPAAM